MGRRNDRIQRGFLLSAGERDALLFACAAARATSPSETELRSVIDFAETARAGELNLQMLLEGLAYPAGFKHGEIGIRTVREDMPGCVRLGKGLKEIRLKKAKIDFVVALQKKVTDEQFLSSEEVKRLSLVHEFATRQSAILEIDLVSFLKLAGRYRQDQLAVQAILRGDVLPRAHANTKVDFVPTAENMSEVQHREHRKAILRLRSAREVP
jgi:hypothetical protein